MKKRIILIGAIYYRNLGDAVLCYSVREMLSEKYDVTVLDIYGRTEFPAVTVTDIDKCRKEFNHNVRRLQLRKLLTRFGIVPYDSKKRKMFETVELQLKHEIEKEKPAAIVFAGGAILKGVFINSVVRILDVAAGYDIPVLFNACGIETEMRSAEWKKIESVLKHPCVRYVSVRDGYELLKEKFCQNFGFDMQVAFWSKLIRGLNRGNYEWYLFTNGAPADQGFAQYLLYHNHENESRLIPCPETPEDLFTTISGFRGIISMRLHSHILACSSCVPCVAVSWDKKVEEFYAKIGKPENCFTFGSSAKDVFSCLRNSMKDKDFFKGNAEREKTVQRNMEILMETIG